jgi:hypothetical protein
VNTNELVAYYANLLVKQYRSKPKAYETVRSVASMVVMPQTTTEVITFSEVAASGSFVVSYGDEVTAAIDWDDSASDIQIKLRAIDGLEDVTVVGSITNKALTVTFVGVLAPALMLELVSTSLEDAGSNPISISISETDITLPLAVQDGFNLTGNNLAVGKQLDILGKYAGVTRSGIGLSGQAITLGDADFLQLILMAVAKNTSGSSLYDIQQILVKFFPGLIKVFDTKNMSLNYYIATALGSFDLIEMVITQGVIPRPMAVNIPFVLFSPIIDNFFGFRTVDSPNLDVSPFNTISNYDLDTHWLSVHDFIVI